MNIDTLEIKKGGYIIIGSIFEVESPLAITELIFKCRDAGCTLRFENEDLTIDKSYNDSDSMRTKVMLYTLLAGNPKAAQDYFNYLFKKANNELAPSN